ncbi:MAG: 30S ribosomal protein S16 [Spirochaetales bacterium]|nr:30S ribosomal protein S16 [Spirochaetales bacterium]
MTSIRLKRFGAQKRPYYRIVVQDSRRATCASTIAELGTYRPVEAENQVTLDVAKCNEWIKQGAKPSDTVKKIFNKQGISLTRSKED